MGVLSRLASSAFLLLLLGCASAGQSTSDSSPDTLSQADLLETNEVTLYRAIQRLRPRWLRERGQRQVFVDGFPRGGLSVLAQIQAIGVVEVRFLSAIDAATLYGTMAGTDGVILVRTR